MSKMTEWTIILAFKRETMAEVSFLVENPGINPKGTIIETIKVSWTLFKEEK